MDQIFNLDNKFFRGVSKIIDCVWLSMLWLLCCIPVFTIGAATTALYYTVNKSIKNDRGYASSEFFSSFKSNFKQSTVIWLIFMAIYALLGFDCYVMYQYGEAGMEIGKLYFVFFIFAVIITMWGFYIFPYIARFENTTKNVLKNTVYIAISNVHWTVVLTVLFIAMWVGIYLFPPVVLIMPVLYNLLKNIAIEHVFKKYMTPEDLELEEERNRNFYN
ncbi:MAG: DUF624 domain-containing protein [Roseburia sp.]|nr:DUF624 domain-containing protein [Roseburia sp.]